jgi:hypothetical protein
MTYLSQLVQPHMWSPPETTARRCGKGTLRSPHASNNCDSHLVADSLQPVTIFQDNPGQRSSDCGAVTNAAAYMCGLFRVLPMGAAAAPSGSEESLAKHAAVS